MKFEFETPKWVDISVNTINYYWKSLKWLVNPPRCAKCGKRLHVQHFDIWHNDGKHNQLGVSIRNPKDFKAKWCQDCVADEVEKTDGTATGLASCKHDRPKKSAPCDCCGTKTKVWKFYETENVSLHFCRSWWNGFWICKTCILDALRNGVAKSSTSKSDGYGGHWFLGAYGLFLNKDGKVRLFKKTKW